MRNLPQGSRYCKTCDKDYEQYRRHVTEIHAQYKELFRCRLDACGLWKGRLGAARDHTKRAHGYFEYDADHRTDPLRWIVTMSVWKKLQPLKGDQQLDVLVSMIELNQTRDAIRVYQPPPLPKPTATVTNEPMKRKALLTGSSGSGSEDIPEVRTVRVTPEPWRIPVRGARPKSPKLTLDQRTPLMSPEVTRTRSVQRRRSIPRKAEPSSWDHSAEHLVSGPIYDPDTPLGPWLRYEDLRPGSSYIEPLRSEGLSTSWESATDEAIIDGLSRFRFDYLQNVDLRDAYTRRVDYLRRQTLKVERAYDARKTRRLSLFSTAGVRALKYHMGRIEQLEESMRTQCSIIPEPLVRAPSVRALLDPQRLTRQCLARHGQTEGAEGFYWLPTEERPPRIPTDLSSPDHSDAEAEEGTLPGDALRVKLTKF